MGDDTASTPLPVLESIAALKHDLAKYVAWRSANFDDQAWTGPLGDDLLAALQADILHTRGDQTAWEIWDTFVAAIPSSLQAPELDDVRDAIDVLREIGPALEAGDRDAVAAARPAIRRAQVAIRSALRDLHRRWLRED